MDLSNRLVAPTRQAPAPATSGPLSVPKDTISGHRDNADRALKGAVEKSMRELRQARRPLGRQQSGE